MMNAGCIYDCCHEIDTNVIDYLHVLDSITHIVLGAVTGEVLLGKKIGKKAMLLGAVAQSIPDIDFVTSFWMNPANSFYAHRGFTHSFLFLIILSLLSPFVLKRLFKKSNMSAAGWGYFIVIQLSLHLFLDLFNAYGTGLLVPFSDQRFSWNTLFVADPLFTIWLLLASIVLLALSKTHKLRMRISWAALVLSTGYLFVAITNKIVTTANVKRHLDQQVHYTSFFTTPTPLNSFLFYVVVKDEYGYYTGYRSVFDTEASLNLRYVPRNDSLLNRLADKQVVNTLMKFSRDYYTVELEHDTLALNVMEFGQISGWLNPNAPFIFHYILTPPANNDNILQARRASDFDKQSLAALWKRMWGANN